MLYKEKPNPLYSIEVGKREETIEVVDYMDGKIKRYYHTENKMIEIEQGKLTKPNLSSSWLLLL